MTFHFSLAVLLLAAFTGRPADKALQSATRLRYVEMRGVSGERFTLEGTAGETVDPEETRSIGSGIKFRNSFFPLSPSWAITRIAPMGACL